ncbi:MAG: glutathione peroxidase [Actinomycetota bacterium]
MGVHDIEVRTIDGEDTTLAEYKGKALLVVNVASKCGFTPQYEGLQELYADYHHRGLEILGFPCNQFLFQEPGSDDRIKDFCSVNYNVTFPLFSKIKVNGGGRHPLYEELTKQPDAGGKAGRVKWNFEKFLVSPHGEVAGRFRTRVTPEDPELIAAVEAQLLDGPRPRAGELGSSA